MIISSGPMMLSSCATVMESDANLEHSASMSARRATASDRWTDSECRSRFFVFLQPASAVFHTSPSVQCANGSVGTMHAPKNHVAGLGVQCHVLQRKIGDFARACDFVAQTFYRQLLKKRRQVFVVIGRRLAFREPIARYRAVCAPRTRTRCQKHRVYQTHDDTTATVTQGLWRAVTFGPWLQLDLLLHL